MPTDSMRRRGESHLEWALLFFTPSPGVAVEDGELVALAGVLVLEVAATIPAPLLPPAVRDTGVGGVVSSLAFQ